MIITQNIIDRVKDETDILELVGSTVQLKKNGVIWKGLCPFHNEKTPSFTVTPDKGIFYCFGCGEGGDAIKWLKLHEGLEFPQAIKALAAKLNVHIEAEPQHTLRPPKSAKSTRRMSQMLEPPEPQPGQIAEIAEACGERLLISGCCQKLQLMISKKNWKTNVIASLTENNYLGADHKGNIVYIYPNGVKCRYDFDSSRGDRWLLGKAKNNIWRAQELRHELVENVFVTEGESDLISLMSHRPEGIQDAYVAIPGSSNADISPTTAYKMGSGRKVFLMFDWDDAGENATEKMAGILNEEALDCEVCRLDWDAMNEDFQVFGDANDIGDLPAEVIKKIDNYFKRI